MFSTFIPGSEIFRRKLSITMFDDKYEKIFITQTLKPSFVQDKDINSAYDQSIKELIKILSIFDIFFIVPELTEKSVLHYHIMGGITKFYNQSKLYLKYKDDLLNPTLVDYIKFILKNRIKTNYDHIFGYENDQFLDVRALSPHIDFISYLYKDIDRLYRCTQYTKVRFVLSSLNEDDLKNLNQLVNFKSNKL